MSLTKKQKKELKSLGKMYFELEEQRRETVKMLAKHKTVTESIKKILVDSGRQTYSFKTETERFTLFFEPRPMTRVKVDLLPTEIREKYAVSSTFYRNRSTKVLLECESDDEDDNGNDE